MKKACYVSIGMFGLFVVATSAGADPSASVPVVNPYTQADPDGVPLAVTHPQAKPLSHEEIEAIHKQQEQAELDKNWLVRNYEQQLRARAGKNGEDPSTNLYYELSSNKDLAKLAGLPALDTDSQDSTIYRTGAPSSQGAVALRAEESASAAVPPPRFFKPLITPLSTPGGAGLHNFYSSLPAFMPSPIPGGPPQAPPAPKTAPSRDLTDIETPGMLAAPNNALTDTLSDPSLDVLPGETIEQAKAHQESNLKFDLPQPMDADQLHKSEDATLSIRGAPTAAKTLTVAPTAVKAPPVEDPDAPLPVNKVPPINPVRSPIANPFDILNR